MTDPDLPAGVFAREFDRLDRAVRLGVAGGRLIKVEFPAAAPDDADPSHDLLDRIADYLGGAADDFADVTVATTVPTETRRVMDACRKVPHGREASVSQVTRMANFDPNEPDDVRTAKEALRGNPVPLVVPDHRVQGGPYATPAEVRETLRSVENL